MSIVLVLVGDLVAGEDSKSNDSVRSFSLLQPVASMANYH